MQQTLKIAASSAGVQVSQSLVIKEGRMQQETDEELGTV